MQRISVAQCRPSMTTFYLIHGRKYIDGNISAESAGLDSVLETKL